MAYDITTVSSPQQQQMFNQIMPLIQRMSAAGVGGGTPLWNIPQLPQGLAPTGDWFGNLDPSIKQGVMAPYQEGAKQLGEQLMSYGGASQRGGPSGSMAAGLGQYWADAAPGMGMQAWNMMDPMRQASMQEWGQNIDMNSFPFRSLPQMAGSTFGTPIVQQDYNPMGDLFGLAGQLGSSYLMGQALGGGGGDGLLGSVGSGVGSSLAPSLLGAGASGIGLGGGSAMPSLLGGGVGAGSIGLAGGTTMPSLLGGGTELGTGLGFGGLETSGLGTGMGLGAGGGSGISAASLGGMGTLGAIGGAALLPILYAMSAGGGSQYGRDPDVPGWYYDMMANKENLEPWQPEPGDVRESPLDKQDRIEAAYAKTLRDRGLPIPW